MSLWKKLFGGSSTPAAQTQKKEPTTTEPSKAVIPQSTANMQYFEQERPNGDGACSWDPCPCGSFGSSIPRGTGHLYIPQSAVDFRRDCVTWRELISKLNRIANRLSSGDRFIFTDVPVLVCEQGKKKLDIDEDVAAADAKHWWATGMIPYRATPPRPKSVVEPSKSVLAAETCDKVNYKSQSNEKKSSVEQDCAKTNGSPNYNTQTSVLYVISLSDYNGTEYMKMEDETTVSNPTFATSMGEEAAKKMLRLASMLPKEHIKIAMVELDKAKADYLATR